MRRMLGLSAELTWGGTAAASDYKYLVDVELWDGPEVADGGFLAWLAPLEEREYAEAAGLVRRLRIGTGSGVCELRR